MSRWDAHQVTAAQALTRLGGGHRYDVWLAHDAARDEDVVLKLLRPHLIADPRALRELRREARALRTLAHPAVVRGLAARETGAQPHLVLEHVPGLRVSTLARRFGADLEQLLPLAGEVLTALEHLVACGWVHLDVKPSNVVMGAVPKLIDLSVARPVEEARRARSAIGTPTFMAPEQCDPARRSTTGAATDLWGLGATLTCALLGGAPPFDPDGRPHPQLRRGPEPLPRRVPRALRELIGGLLADDPRDRPTHADVRAVLTGAGRQLPAPVLHRFRPSSPTQTPNSRRTPHADQSTGRAHALLRARAGRHRRRDRARDGRG